MTETLRDDHGQAASERSEQIEAEKESRDAQVAETRKRRLISGQAGGPVASTTTSAGMSVAEAERLGEYNLYNG